MADIPTEQATAPMRRRRIDKPRLIRLLPGTLAALLFLALATGDAFLGRGAGLAQRLLALLLAGAVVAQPAVAGALRRVAARRGMRHAAAVAAVVALALLLRAWGLRFGLPYLEHPDEWAVADQAVHMLQTGDYSPHSFVYPTLYTYLQLGVAVVHFLWGVSAGVYRTLADIDPPRYYAWARALTALLGSGAVLGVYAAGRMLYGRAAGLLAAALLAVYPAAAGDAHYVTTDTPSMFFSLLAFLAIVRLGLQPPAGRRDRWALALIAGFCTGLAIATKYNTAVLVIPLLLAAAMGSRRPTIDDRRLTIDGKADLETRRGGDKERGGHGDIETRGTVELQPSALSPQPSALSPQFWGTAIWIGLAALLGVLIGFTLGTPAWLSEFPRMLDDVASVVVHYKFAGHPGAESARPWMSYWDEFARNGLLLAWAFLAGALLAFVRWRRADLLVLGFAVPYFLQMASVKVVFFRNAMPLLPFLCLLAAAAVTAVVDRSGAIDRAAGPEGQAGRTPRGAGLASLAIRREVLLALALVALAAQPLALAVHDDWLRAQPTTRLLATEWVSAHAPDGTRIWLEDQTLILPARLRVQGGAPLTTHDLDWYRTNGFRYLVANEDAPRDDGDRLARFGAPAARFEAAGQRHGPALAVYDTGLADPRSAPHTPSGATLGGGAIVLDGYQHPAQAQPGALLPLALYWRVERALPIDYTVYVHLLDAGGNTVAQRDLPPLDGSLPTTRWKAGDRIRDDQDLPLPGSLAPGTYRLVVGMYDPRTMASINDAGPIDVGTVAIGP